MNNITIIYWSGTGNTEMMANAIEVGAGQNSDSVKVINVEIAKPSDVKDADIVVFGCPAMGAEELEEEEMQPFIENCSQDLKGKKIALFGSYGWGNGEWMDEWKEQMVGYGANIIQDSLIINETPDEQALKTCKEFGNKLISA